jgi:O-antigen ligase
MPPRSDSSSSPDGLSSRRHGRRFRKLEGERSEAAGKTPVQGPLTAGARESAKRLKLHPLELALLWVVAAHLIFLPWAIGAVRWWGQLASVGFSVVSFALALLPRNYTPEHSDAPAFRLLPWPKLLRFPIFWLGLALLALVTVQGLNPAWEYRSDGKSWWMQAIPHVTWLPHGVRVPLVQAPGLASSNPWRSLVVYASGWLTVCAIWAGFTRRRALQRLFLVLVVDGIAIALLGLLERFAALPFFSLFELPPGANFFGTFIYKNHAGAYLDLMIGLTCGLGAWYHARGLRRMEKSSPGGIFVFFATILAVAVVVSFARGATLTMLVYLVVSGVGFIVHQLFFAPEVTRKPVIIVALLLVFGFFLKTGLEAVNTGEAWSRIKGGFENGGDFSLRTRLAATKASLEMYQDHPVLGIGAGSFPYLFTRYQLRHSELLYFPDSQRRQFWPHAHNDWVEFPNEFGVPGMLVLLACFVWYGLTLVRNYFWSNPFSVLVVFGLIAVWLYSYWDFPFQCPAILITWCAIWPMVTRWTILEEQRGPG